MEIVTNSFTLTLSGMAMSSTDHKFSFNIKNVTPTVRNGLYMYNIMFKNNYYDVIRTDNLLKLFKNVHFRMSYICLNFNLLLVDTLPLLRIFI